MEANGASLHCGEIHKTLNHKGEFKKNIYLLLLLWSLYNEHKEGIGEGERRLFAPWHTLETRVPLEYVASYIRRLDSSLEEWIRLVR